jgi:RNA polymerase sigma factor (sigma-70 family)
MMTHLTQKLRGLLSSCRRWGHSSDEAEDLVQEALLAVEAYSRDHEVRDPHALLVTTLKHHSINASRRAKRMTTVSMSDTGEDAEDVTVLADPRSGPEEVCSVQQQLEQIEALLVQRCGRTTYEVFMYQRSGNTHQETARQFKLTERAVQTHIARAMFALINQRAGEQE